ncbi:class I SAM-dependent methyltransferase [Aquibacillus salsiterrae]|uniref:Class I SAM-dependent methyltransferase n=1 Tax=Aquibacillus salsiterrae TaxID=2950439 RepID=A0A9X3WEB5_9BACI|nr:class I SAM-dependent methyltransferase [Aquibacillus salsiterrae]MDC3417448.1 class I SAM-dependent methyltransferase [Aquibacillus salsiterrae]
MLKDTGERVIPENMKITNALLVEHIARYHFATNYVQGRVLDFASGAGYGSHIIAKQCKKQVEEIVGIDIDEEAIQYAKGTYYHPLTSFIQGDVTDPSLPEELGAFDTIISFETIEHIKNEEQFLTNIYHLLKPGGTLVLSTPFGQGRGQPCGSPFHVHQLTVNEFTNLFPEYEEKTFYFQRGALIEPAFLGTKEYYPLGIVVAKK